MDGLERKVDLTMAEESTNVSQSAQNESETTQTNETNNDQSNNNNVSETAQNNRELDIEKLIQKAVDRATNKLGNDNKKLRKQLDTLKKDKLTDDELKRLEIAEKEADIADREAKLRERENRLFAIKAIKDAGLDDGSSNALELVDFVMTGDEETTTARVKAFDALVKKFVSAEVNRTFRDNGRNPNTGENTSTNNKNDLVNIVVESIGQMAADRESESRAIINQYLGGKK